MLRQVAQRAEDRVRATAFYRDVVGLPFLQEFEPPGLSFFDLGGGTRLLLEQGAAGVTFVDEIHRIHVHDGTMAPPGTEEWMTFFRDSEGNLVGLCEQRPGS